MNLSIPMLPKAAGTAGDGAVGQADAAAVNGGLPQDPSQLFSLLLSGRLQALHPVLAGRHGGGGESGGQSALPQDGNPLPLAQLLAEILGGADGVYGDDGQHAPVKAGDPDTPEQLAPGAEAAMAALQRALAAQPPQAVTPDKLRAAITEALSVESAAGDIGRQRLLQALVARLETAQPAQAGVAGSSGHDTKDPAAITNLSAVHAMAKPDGMQPFRPGVPATVAVEQPVRQPGWDRELGSRIVWMTRENLQSAQLSLNPPHLGPVEVRVSIQHDMANVSFIAHHAQARDAIEAAIPRLREMMGASGFGQTHVDVSGHSFAQGQQYPAQSPGGGLHDAGIEDDLMTGEAAVLRTDVSRNVGMVDYFA